MAGTLIKIDEEIVTSAVASVTLTAIDSTYDVYMVRFNNVIGTSGNNNLEVRVTESGTPNTTSNYDFAHKELDATGAFDNRSATNSDHFQVNIQVGNDPLFNEQSNGVMYIFNANNSGEYTFLTYETVFLNPFSGGLYGSQGGGVFTSASTVDGLNIFFSTGNIDNGNFVMYGLSK